MEHLGLSELPSEITKLETLRELYVDNLLETIDPEVLALSQLTLLDLFCIRIDFVTGEIGSFKSLSHLTLSANQITATPESLCELPSLTYLNLNCNQLTSLPDQFARLTALTHLDLSDIQFSAVPDEFLNLPNLAYLDLRGNPIAEEHNFCALQPTQYNYQHLLPSHNLCQLFQTNL